MTRCLRWRRRSPWPHHERADGTGYPYGLSGDAIPVEAGVVAVVDVFDALLSTRPHRDSMTVPEALDEIDLRPRRSTS